MNFAAIPAALVHALLWTIPLGLIAVVVRTSWYKGIYGAAVVRLYAQLFLDPENYRAFHHVALSTEDGATVLDDVFVSRFGIFVVETTNMKGWIFGESHQPTWTQKLLRRRYRFQNPLRQTFKHAKAIEAALGLAAEKVFPVVVFIGGSTFRTPMPPHVRYASTYIGYIKSKVEPIFSDEEVMKLCDAIAAGRLVASSRTSRQPVRSPERRHAVKAETACPHCGAPMVMRSVKSGARQGSEFLGCSAYPHCRGMRIPVKSRAV